MEVCGRWLPSGVPNCEQGKEERNTAVTRLDKTSPSVRVCVRTKLVKDLAKWEKETPQSLGSKRHRQVSGCAFTLSSKKPR